MVNMANTSHTGFFYTILAIKARHYNDAIMSVIASQITGVPIVYLTVCSGADQREHQSSASLAFVGGIHTVTGDFPVQRASNAENVSIWWRHYHDGLSLRCIV